ncbi:MAG: ROK family protein [Micrococcaceae bacterium]
MILALDMGGTKVAAAVFTPDGKLLEKTFTKEETGQDKNAEELFEACAHVLKKASQGYDIQGIGIGCAAPIDIFEGTVSPLNLKAWRKFPLKARVQELFPGVPVKLHTDGTCIALGEHWKGAGQGVKDMMAMVVSTGVGGGLILNGKPYDGASGNAGHVGHIEVAGFEDVPCVCGGAGCLEMLCSGPHTVQWAIDQGWRKGQDTSTLTGEDLTNDAKAGDKIAVSAFNRAGTALGRAIASAMALIECEKVVISGGFASAGDLLFEPARKAMIRKNMKFVDVPIVPSTLDGYGPITGVAALIGTQDQSLLD